MGVEMLSGNGLFKARMTRMRSRCMDFSPAFAIIDRQFLKFESKKFASEGPGWAPLQQQTIDRKVGLSDKILVRGEPNHTEGLKNSLTTHGSGSLFNMTPFTLTEGTSVSYAQYHQSGDEYMPARPPFIDHGGLDSPMGAVQMAKWFRILQAYFVEGIGAASAIGSAGAI